MIRFHIGVLSSIVLVLSLFASIDMIYDLFYSRISLVKDFEEIFENTFILKFANELWGEVLDTWGKEQQFEEAFNYNTRLLIVVISARSNFRERKIIRETWGRLARQHVELKFLVGKDACPIPLEDRTTKFNCDMWIVNLPDVIEHSTIGEYLSTDTCSLGFTFLIKSSVVVTKIGLDYNVFNGSQVAKARVVLYDSSKDLKLASATFLKGDFTGFKWKSINPVALEEGFEGELKLIEEDLQISQCRNSLEYTSAVHFFETVGNNGNYSHFRYMDTQAILVGMKYTLKDEMGLKKFFVNRTERMKTVSLQNAVVAQRLEDEQMTDGDLLFLQGFIDVYDNLSYKLQTFFEWLKNENRWEYILKTDDDVFIDLPFVEEGLKEDWDLWTCHRHQVPNPHGKWRDRINPRYPPFPSGSGYVIRVNALRNITLEPRKGLGEDVMVGFSTQHFKKPLKSPCFWACGVKRMKSPECNVPELSVNEMRKLWDFYKQLGQIPFLSGS